jgi:hypothetical protein
MSTFFHRRLASRILLQRGLMVASLLLGSAAAVRAGQLGALVAPGPLSRAHAALEGVTNCVKCHDATRQESAAKCLSCHKPIAERIARKTGVHRAVTNDCARCHAEHGGPDAELRKFDVQSFDHTAETGFALEGRHAAVSAKCAACHLKRSFLETRTACGSCHQDTHKNVLGPDCARCHSPRVTFKAARTQFDHARTQFMLVGAHRAVACEKCHAGGAFRGLQHETCTPCHQEPHKKKFGSSCTTCHNQLEWATRLVDHKKTGFTLVGAHVRLDCAKCHPSGMTKPLRSDQCSACHSNLHRASVKEDCRACHTEAGWRGATFDHRARTAFPLVGKHDGLVCRKCHTGITPENVPLDRKVVDFGGVKSECAACHADTHKGAYGRACDICHRPATFKTAGFAHPRTPDFFAGRHMSLTCAQCHLRGGPQPSHAATVAVAAPPKPPSMTCVACHADVHLGQVGTACERCHAIDAERFAPSRFSHQQAAFQLTGKHQSVACAKCHPSETRAFPAGRGTATRLTPTPTTCASCHKDPHMGQVSAECGTCHSAATFGLSNYTHTGLGDLFAPLHGRLPCQSCHKNETGQFPKGKGTAIRFKVGRTCTTCHSQV